MSDRIPFRRGAALLLTSALVLGSLTACGDTLLSTASSASSASSSVSSASVSSSSPAGSAHSGSDVAPSDPVSAPEQADSALLPTHATPDAPEDQPASPSVPQEKGASSYDFSQPVPENEAVEVSYFDDAAFVGDSRTDGFLIYSGIGRGKNLTSNGLSIFKLETKKAITIDGQSYTLLDALALEQYGKVYLSLGINELGYNDDKGFYRSYCQAIDRIREVQPNAVIYIQGLIPVNEDVIAQTSGRTYLTNDHLRVYNDLMKQAAQEKQVVYLDLYSEFVDENGQLPADASKDGVHLRSAWCKQWLAYLETHTVDYDTLYPDGAPQPTPDQPDTQEGGAVQ